MEKKKYEVSRWKNAGTAFFKNVVGSGEKEVLSLMYGKMQGRRFLKMAG